MAWKMKANYPREKGEFVDDFYARQGKLEAFWRHFARVWRMARDKQTYCKLGVRRYNTRCRAAGGAAALFRSAISGAALCELVLCGVVFVAV